MNEMTFSTRGHTAALDYAIKELMEHGWSLHESAPIVLLPVPSFDANGHIKGGGTIEDIPKDSLIIGGNLSTALTKNRKFVDLLQNPLYLSENAAITAHCAICIVMENLPVTLQQCPILVVGWGRIGKCLVRLLRMLGAKITVAARSEADRALTEALGYTAVNILDENLDLSPYRVIINTVPAMVLPGSKLSDCRRDCLKIDLASSRGIDGSDVIWARGLPNQDAPESSGKLIAKIFRKEFEL